MDSLELPDFFASLSELRAALATLSATIPSLDDRIAYLENGSISLIVLERKFIECWIGLAQVVDMTS